MGMFDYVKFKAPCGNCGEILSEFQTKDKDDPFMQRLNIDDPDLKNFYTSCPKCGWWNQYEKKWSDNNWNLIISKTIHVGKIKD